MKTALLSNVNVDYVNKILFKQIDIIPPVGYGDVWGQILDGNSIFNQSSPDNIFFIIDIEQLIKNCVDYNGAKNVIDEWFEQFDSIVNVHIDYFVAEIMFRHDCVLENDNLSETKLVLYWNEKIESRINEFSNIHVLKLNYAILNRGREKIFSDKMWYMGKIPYSNEGCNIIADRVIDAVKLISKSSKKVLLLDLDNTLWGGVLGEEGIYGIKISENGIGAVYMDVQNHIKMMKNKGVILGIVSKNNEHDIEELWQKRSEMVLKKEDFVSIRINWEDKADNILSIAKELNLGLDSMVFIDDSQTERENIKFRLPEVTVPDFPMDIERYPVYMKHIYDEYFKKCRLSDEDIIKTRQYEENIMRDKASQGLSFEDFLMSLKLRVKRVNLDERKIDRIAQLHGKTNQFNLTTQRFNRQDIIRMLEEGYGIYSYEVSDRFGEYGLVIAAIVDYKKSEIISFLMSCRVMGKLLENYVIDCIEDDMIGKGIKTLYGKYIPTKKNMPAADFYDKLGYEVIEKDKNFTLYALNLEKKESRKYFVYNDNDKLLGDWL